MVFTFLGSGLLLANLCAWLLLRAAGRWRFLPVLALLAAWLAAPALLDDSVGRAAHPGHALAIGAACFAVMGFPAWGAHKLLPRGAHSAART